MWMQKFPEIWKQAQNQISYRRNGGLHPVREIESHKARELNASLHKMSGIVVEN